MVKINFEDMRTYNIYDIHFVPFFNTNIHFVPGICKLEFKHLFIGKDMAREQPKLVRNVNFSIHY